MRSILALAAAFLLFVSGASAGEVHRDFRAAAADEIDEHFVAGNGDAASAAGHSRARAFLLSTLLPGLGQRYNDSTLRSRAFFAVEAAIWTSFIVFKGQETMRTDDFEEYARAYADVGPGEKDFEFYRILTIYDDVDQYNESVRIEARAIYPDDLDAQNRYFAENGYESEKSFRWKTNDKRLSYRLLRNDALDSGRRADYALVAAVLNRAIAAVEAARAAGHFSRVAGAARHLRIEAPPAGDPVALRLAVAARF